MVFDQTKIETQVSTGGITVSGTPLGRQMENNCIHHRHDRQNDIYVIDVERNVG